MSSEFASRQFKVVSFTDDVKSIIMLPLPSVSNPRFGVLYPSLLQVVVAVVVIAAAAAEVVVISSGYSCGSRNIQ